jgi:hypothetical protein
MLSRLRRSLVGRRPQRRQRAPLTRVQGRFAIRPVVDASSLSTRRPWWLVARRWVLQRRLAANSVAIDAEIAGTVPVDGPPDDLRAHRPLTPRRPALARAPRLSPAVGGGTELPLPAPPRFSRAAVATVPWSDVDGGIAAESLSAQPMPTGRRRVATVPARPPLTAARRAVAATTVPPTLPPSKPALRRPAPVRRPAGLRITSRSAPHLPGRHAVAGPDMSNLTTVTELPVLGGSSVAANEPSLFGGVVEASPAWSPIRKVSPVRRPVPARKLPETPQERWRSAVARRPLETPRPFPTSMQPLVRAIVGNRRVSYTTGVATRQALALAGAHGATTGSIVHLPQAPTHSSPRMLGIVAHELAHASRPVGRPRFFLRSLTSMAGHLDHDEHDALGLGHRVQAAATRGNVMGGGVVGDLPVGGGSGASDAVRNAVRSGASQRTPDLHAPSLGTGTGTGGLPSFGSSMPSVPGAPHLPDLPGGAPHLPNVPHPNLPSGGPTASVPADHGSPGGGGSGGAAPPSAGSPAGGNVDIDQIAEALEERVLRQLERRGGRYAGVF